MAVMAGKDGEIKFGDNRVGYIDNFSVNVNLGSAEVSQIGKQWREYIPACSDWSGSISGTLDYADAAQKEIVDELLTPTDQLFTVELKVGPALTVTGDIIITSASITGSFADKVAVSFNFQGSDALSVKSIA